MCNTGERCMEKHSCEYTPIFSLHYKWVVLYPEIIHAGNDNPNNIHHYVDGNQGVSHKAWPLTHPEAGADGATLHHIGACPGGYLVAVCLWLSVSPVGNIWRGGCALAVVARGAHRLDGWESVLKGAAVG